MRRSFLAVSLAICLLTALPACWATPTLGEESALPSYKGYPMRPRMSGGYVVALQNVENADGNSDTKGIIVYSLATSKAFTVRDGRTGWCDIWGDLAAWTVNPSTPLQGKVSLKSNKQATTSATSNLMLENVQTWEHYDPPLGESGPAFGPVIWQNYVAYLGAKKQIYLMDLTDGHWTQISKSGTTNEVPGIGPDLVTWNENVDKKRQVRAYRISTGELKNITDDPSVDHYGSSTDGRYIVWKDKGFTIGLYDMKAGATVPVSTEGFYTVVGNGILAYVKWLDKTSAAVFGYDLATQKEFRISKGTTDCGPRINNGRVMWTDKDKIYWVPFWQEKK
jgi:hypothetical protein